MKEENNNMKLWNSVKETDPKFTKLVGFGRKFTSINAQWQIQQATKQFGAYGDKWGLASIEYQYITALPNNQVMAICNAVFRHPTGQFPISSTIMVSQWNNKKSELRVDDEWAKKVETDITTKALSKLGFSADVFLGQYDDNRYVNSMREKYEEETPIIKMAVTDDLKKRMETAIESGKADDVSKTLSKFSDSPNKKAIQKLIKELDLEVQNDK